MRRSPSPNDSRRCAVTRARVWPGVITWRSKSGRRPKKASIGVKRSVCCEVTQVRTANPGAAASAWTSGASLMASGRVPMTTSTCTESLLGGQCVPLAGDLLVQGGRVLPTLLPPELGGDLPLAVGRVTVHLGQPATALGVMSEVVNPDRVTD